VGRSPPPEPRAHVNWDEGAVQGGPQPLHSSGAPAAQSTVYASAKSSVSGHGGLEDTDGEEALGNDTAGGGGATDQVCRGYYHRHFAIAYV
jgi:hypothetical protein